MWDWIASCGLTARKSLDSQLGQWSSESFVVSKITKGFE